MRANTYRYTSIFRSMTAGVSPARLAGTAALALFVSLAGSCLRETSALTRDALWPVVRTCVNDRELTGAPFPCLEVNLGAGEGNGYAVLRPPIGRPDTILVPTRRSIGIEDPWLRDPAAPNYFDAAWRARALATGVADIPDDRVGLAVNSKFKRTQDQFHVHIGCLAPGPRLWMRAAAATLDPGAWRELPPRAGRSAIWALTIRSDDFPRTNPIERIASDLPGADHRAGLAAFTLALAPASLPGGNEGFVAFAWRHDPAGSEEQMTAEDFLAASCR